MTPSNFKHSIFALPSRTRSYFSRERLEQLVDRCYLHLTFVRCVAYALAVYCIVWVTAVERLSRASILEKTRVAATMVTATTRPSVEMPAKWESLRPSVKSQDLIFHPIGVDGRPLSQAATERKFLDAATELSGIREDDPAFLGALARFNYCGECLRGRNYAHAPFYARYFGNNEYSGCSVSVPPASGIGLRASANLFLRYADAFADALPWTTISPSADPRLIQLAGPTTAKSARSSLIRAIPFDVAAAPWRMFAFRDSSFAALCDGLPKATLFLLLAFYFMAEIRYRSVGPGGLFAHRRRPARRVVTALWWLIVGVPVIVVFAEGRETPLEVMRLAPLFAAVLAGASLIHCLDGMRRSPLAERFVALQFAERRQRLIPFAIGAACVFAGALWGIKYSLFTLVLRFDGPSMARGFAQAIALTWMLLLVCIILGRLLFTIPPTDLAPPAPAPKVPASDDGRASYYREFSKAIALLLSPFFVQFLEWFTAA